MDRFYVRPVEGELKTLQGNLHSERAQKTKAESVVIKLREELESCQSHPDRRNGDCASQLVEMRKRAENCATDLERLRNQLGPGQTSADDADAHDSKNLAKDLATCKERLQTFRMQVEDEWELKPREVTRLLDGEVKLRVTRIESNGVCLDLYILNRWQRVPKLAKGGAFEFNYRDKRYQVVVVEFDVFKPQWARIGLERSEIGSQTR